MTRGGKREGAGRPKGENQYIFYARVTKEEKKLLTDFLNKIRKKEELK